MTIDIEKLAQDMFGTVLVNDKEYYEIDSKEWTNLAEAYAAKVLEDKEREIAELKTTVRSDNSKVIAALNAHVNDLREALNMMRDAFDVGGDVTSVENDALYKADNALSKTPAQSLIEYDNEVIERCAKVCDESYAFDSDGFAKAIRALKGK